MRTYTEVHRVKLTATTEFNRYSIRLWAVLSLIFSLTAAVILSKNDFVTHRWVFVAALVVPLSTTLYFRNRIAQFGPFVYVGALLSMLGVAIFFGM